MSSQLGPLEICCDAPPYPVVRACSRIGIRTPEDVRWLRMREFLTRPEGGQQGAGILLGKVLWGMGKRRTCTCGEPLPGLSLVVMTFDTGDDVSYLLGQCRRCGTVFWDEP